MKFSFCARGSQRKCRKSAGFTLVELLVVIGIIALLISILLPTLGKARRAASTLTCASSMRSITQGLQLYMNAYKGAIPGSPHTSGAHMVTSTGTVTGQNYGIIAAHDWMSPIAKMLRIPFNEGTGPATIEADRTARFRTLINRPEFRCSENEFTAWMFGSGLSGISSGANGEFFPWVSYSTSIDFMILPGTSSAGRMTGRAEWQAPPGYVPKISKIGNPSEKIFLAEGARFVDASTYPRVTLDFDAAVITTNGGLFSEQRGFCGTPTSFNRSRLLFNGYANKSVAINPNDSKYLMLFARHGSRRSGDQLGSYRMNVVFFDGHVETMSVIDAMRPSLWGPKGMQYSIDDAQCYPIVRQTYFNNRPAGFTYIVP